MKTDNSQPRIHLVTPGNISDAALGPLVADATHPPAAAAAATPSTPATSPAAASPSTSTTTPAATSTYTAPTQTQEQGYYYQGS